MRLKEAEVQAIKSTIQALDAKAKIYLFGSRADDTKRGGDIDLLTGGDTLASLTVNGEAVAVTGTTLITGVYGDLVIDIDGNWSYTLRASTPDHPGINQTGAADQVQDSFSVLVTDSDGDTAGSNLTISVGTLPAWLTFTDNGDGTVNGDVSTFPLTVTGLVGTSDNDPPIQVDDTGTLRGSSTLQFDGINDNAPDHDGDGWLDLYVGNYVLFDFSLHFECPDPLGVPGYCGPLAYASQGDSLFRNRGDGTFENVTAAVLQYEGAKVGTLYLTSAEIASQTGPFEGYAENREPMLEVIRKHRAAVNTINANRVPTDLLEEAETVWREAYALGHDYGYRNSQVTVLATPESGWSTFSA